MNRPLLLLVGAAFAFQAGAGNEKAEYTLTSPGLVLAGYVTGTAVPITVTSSERFGRGSLKLTLNGVDVTAALHADGPMAMSGVVAGRQPVAIVFEVLAKENGKQRNDDGNPGNHYVREKHSDAQLTIMNAIAPATTCDLNTISNLPGFPIQPSATMAGT